MDLSGPLCYIVAQKEAFNMAENDIVRARIDGRIKTEAAAVLAAMGLTVSDAFRLLITRVAAEKALPFAPLTPNAETVKAIKAARRGEVTKVRGNKKLFESLDAELPDNE